MKIDCSKQLITEGADGRTEKVTPCRAKNQSMYMGCIDVNSYDENLKLNWIDQFKRIEISATVLVFYNMTYKEHSTFIIELHVIGKRNV